MTTNQTDKGKEMEEHLSDVNMDPWFFIYENYIKSHSKETSHKENTSSTIQQPNIDSSDVDRKKIDLQEYEQKCQEILDDEEIRFVGLLDEFGTTLVGGYKQGMNPRLTEEQHKTVCKELASRIAKRKKFDTELGRVKYSASRREHVVIMSFPIYEKVIMIVAEPNVNIDRLSYRIINKLDRQWGDYT